MKSKKELHICYWLEIMSKTEGNTKYTLHKCQICGDTKITSEKIKVQKADPNEEKAKKEEVMPSLRSKHHHKNRTYNPAA
ncbi:MAG: hypothetical protein OIF36_00905 [Alphaproteobacteria bacterium]|nr:hypothetical protein [Alphaproteobacteria bacterium]